jgi:acyl-CoA thioesterase
MAGSQAEGMSLVELMTLERFSGKGGKKEKASLATFMSVNSSFDPGFGSAYGGHVYAQSGRAASLTVVEGMVIHVCFFIHAPAYSCLMKSV